MCPTLYNSNIKSSSHDDATTLVLAFEADLICVDHVGNDVGGKTFIVRETVDDSDQFRQGGAAIMARFVTVSLHAF